MKNLVIIAAGGCGREVLQWAVDVNKLNPTWRIKGFLDDNPNALMEKRCKYPIIGTVDDYEIEAEDEFVCCIGNSSVRESIVDKMQAKGGTFANVIHPTALVSDTASLGEGIILYPYSIISDNAVLGDYTIINMHSCVAHDSFVGRYATISAFCDITGNCNVNDYAFMGTGSKLVPGISIGKSVFICAGSIVMTRVKDGIKVMGNPARKFGM